MMKLGDKVHDALMDKVGVIEGEFFYRNFKAEGCLRSLACRVNFEGSSIICGVEQLTLHDAPQLCEFIDVQISMHSELYWGMVGTLQSIGSNGAFVRLAGYESNIWFNLDCIEPLSNTASLMSWLDSL